MDGQNSKGQFGSKLGFLMAAVGSAVGLGNLWGFPYKMGKSGGFAFLIIYLVLTAIVGVAIMLTELSLGRKTGKGVIYAYKELSNKYTFVGVMGWLSPLLITGFYCMLGGYCLYYAIANIGDLFHASWGVGDTAADVFFGNFVVNQGLTSLFTLIFAAITVFIVLGGVSGGIEKFSTIAMPILFFALVIVIIRSCTLPGASKGLAFVFKPDMSVIKEHGFISTLATAGGQMFFSLSLAMGIMVTFGSYLSKNEDLQENAIIIPIADTIIAIMAAMATMPACFAGGLEPNQGPGMLFITMQIVFKEMGTVGPIFGFLFYGLVFIAAVTSSISLMEAIASTLMDRDIRKGKEVNRKKSTLIVGAIILAEGILISLDGLGGNGFPKLLGQGCMLDAFDIISEGIMMPLGAFFTAIIFGWFHNTYVDDEIEQAGKKFWMKNFYRFCMKVTVPIIMFLVLLGQLDGIFGLGIFK